MQIRSLQDQSCDAPRGAVRDPLIPSWGEPELLMNLAWDNLNRKRWTGLRLRSTLARRSRLFHIGTTSGTFCSLRLRRAVRANDAVCAWQRAL